jgi:hypothetical protein
MFSTFIESVFEKPWIDMGKTRKFTTLLWLVVIAISCLLLAKALNREVFGGSEDIGGFVIISAISALMIAAYHWGLKLIFKSNQTGVYLEKRSSAKLKGVLLASTGFLLLFFANSSNIHYYLTRSDATQSDITELNQALTALESAMQEFFKQNNNQFREKSDMLINGVITEITGSTNAGWNTVSQRKLAAFNEYTQLAVQAQSGGEKLSRHSPNLQKFAATLRADLEAARDGKLHRMAVVQQEVEKMLEDHRYTALKEDLQNHLEDLSDSNKSNTPFLKGGFALFHEYTNKFSDKLKDKSLRFIDEPKLPILAETPYSSDIRTLGKMWSLLGGQSSAKLLTAKFFIAILFSGVFDLLVGWFFYSLLSRKD